MSGHTSPAYKKKQARYDVCLPKIAAIDIENIHIISGRKASRKEKRVYEEGTY
jgi:uncharacterized DUF497 family protein